MLLRDHSIPRLGAIIDPWFIIPDFIVELVVAFWLTFKGVNLVSPPPLAA